MERFNQGMVESVTLYIKLRLYSIEVTSASYFYRQSNLKKQTKTQQQTVIWIKGVKLIISILFNLVKTDDIYFLL